MENLSQLGTIPILILMIVREVLNYLKERNGHATAKVTHIKEQNEMLDDLKADLQAIRESLKNVNNQTKP